MHELPWITILGHKWGDLPTIITSDESQVKIIGKSLHE